MNVPLMELLIHFDCAVNIEKYADYLRLILDQLILTPPPKKKNLLGSIDISLFRILLRQNSV
jgi:hypothetical protein